MGTVVHSEAQEGNKYILTLIMKAIVTYALAAFAAIAATPNPIEATPAPYDQRYNFDDALLHDERLTKREEYAGQYISEAKLHDERLTKREEYDEEFAPQQ